MAVKTDAQLKSTIDSAITTNGLQEITGAILNGVQTDIIDSKVSVTDAETIAGVKTFSSSPIVPIPKTDYQTAPKKYIDDLLPSNFYKKSSYGVYGYISVKANTTITTATTYYPIMGTFVNPILSSFVTTATPSIQFTGEYTTLFEIDWHASISSGTASTAVSTAVYHDGSIVAGSDMVTYCKNAGESYAASGTCVVSLNNLDEIELVCTADRSGVVLTYNKFTATIRAFTM